MLLRHTSDAVKERQGLTINPAKTCQPVGAMYAALGVHGCLPHSHGSQGCCSYHRSALTRHFKEPVMAATSSFTEGSSVFGGQANLLQGLNNIFNVYEPEIVAVHSTCLSETIGDDLKQICEKAVKDGKVPEGKKVIQAPTPSFVGSHITGYSNMTAAIATQLGDSTGEKIDQINVVNGWMEPSDMVEVKRLVGAMGLNSVAFPDVSGVLDAPQTGTHEFYPDGGTTQAELATIGDSKKTIALGPFSSDLAAKAIDTKWKVPFKTIEIPYGLTATDDFISSLAKITGAPVPAEVMVERGQLVDMITDMQQYLYGKRVAIFGDPDWVLPMVQFMLDLDMKPVYIVSGTPGKAFEAKLEELYKDKEIEVKYKNGPQADMFLMHQWIKEENVDLLVGNTYGKYIAKDDDIPFMRMGFPIVDRVGHAQFASVGYKGGMRVLEKILTLLMDRIDRDAADPSFELVM